MKWKDPNAEPNLKRIQQDKSTCRVQNKKIISVNKNNSNFAIKWVKIQ